MQVIWKKEEDGYRWGKYILIQQRRSKFQLCIEKISGRYVTITPIVESKRMCICTCIVELLEHG